MEPGHRRWGEAITKSRAFLNFKSVSQTSIGLVLRRVQRKKEWSEMDSIQLLACFLLLTVVLVAADSGSGRTHPQIRGCGLCA